MEKSTKVYNLKSLVLVTNLKNKLYILVSTQNQKRIGFTTL